MAGPALPVHHPSDALLVDYATGGLAEAAALAVATHLAYCPGCRRVVAESEAIGGALIELVEPRALRSSDVALTEPGSREAATPPSAAPSMFPEPLASYLPAGGAGIRWRTTMPGHFEYRLPKSVRGGRASLLRVPPGRAMPAHGHRGQELTLVLNGGFTDAAGHFGVGDLALADQAVEHQPMADPGDDCIVLIILEAPVRLTHPLGRLMTRLRIVR